MRTVAIPLILALASACQRSRGSESEESLVQAAVLDSLFVRDSTRQLVVGDSSVSGGSHFVDEDYASALRVLGQLPDGVQADFEGKRGTRRRVDSLRTRVPMERFVAADRDSLPRFGSPSSYWQAFYHRFPGSSGVIHLSRVGFSRDGAWALMLVEYGCGGLCGGTIYVLLSHQSGRWRVVRTAQPRIA